MYLSANNNNVDSALQSLHCVNVGSVPDNLEMHAASIFMLEVRRVSECSCIYIFFGPAAPWGEIVGAGAWPNSRGTVDMKCPVCGPPSKIPLATDISKQSSTKRGMR
jgi:hypothetical protein